MGTSIEGLQRLHHYFTMHAYLGKTHSMIYTIHLVLYQHGSYALDWGIPPFGFIFASFMVACMIGSSIFAIGLSVSVPVEKLALYLLAAAFASILIAVAFSTK